MDKYDQLMAYAASPVFLFATAQEFIQDWAQTPSLSSEKIEEELAILLWIDTDPYLEVERDTQVDFINQARKEVTDEDPVTLIELLVAKASKLFKEEHVRQQPQAPLLLRLGGTPDKAIPWTLSKKNLGNSVIPCDILIVSGSLDRVSPLQSLYKRCLPLNQGNPLILPRISNDTVYPLDWPAPLVREDPSDKRSLVPMWKQLLWLPEREGHALDTRLVILSTYLHKLTKDFVVPTSISLPLIRTTEATLDLHSRVERLTSMLLEFNKEKLPNLSKFIIYTDKTEILHLVNYHVQSYSSLHFLEQSEKFGAMINETRQVFGESFPMPPMIKRGLDIVETLLETSTKQGRELFVEAEYHKAACLIAGNCQAIASSIRQITEYLVHIVSKALKKHDKELYGRVKELKMVGQKVSQLKEYTKENSHSDLVRPIRQDWISVFKKFDTLRVVCSQLQHVDSESYIASLDACDLIFPLIGAAHHTKALFSILFFCLLSVTTCRL
eukprot:TRINITY_DN1808_c1_g1_i3.p1 TRINITY_DN1808_c1_g1~~TRINITY_DN1808_c1_g1_i3.p1  ORF type:complete len:498 (-),score=86.51 TRINITY_DN1808_c1_g1_i3:496-1989(-)